MFEIHHFYVEGKANREKKIMPYAAPCDGGGARKRRPQAPEGERSGGELGGSPGCKSPLRAFGLTPLGMFVGRFRDPQAAFAAAEGLEFGEPFVAGTVRAKRRARPQLGQAG